MTTSDSTSESGDLQGMEKAEELIYPYLNTTSAFYWQINIIKNKLRCLNDYRIPGLESKTSQLLQNMNYSRAVIFEKDFQRFSDFMKEIKKRKAASVLVRVTAHDGTMRWLKISGWPDPHKSSCAFGFISDETKLISQVLASDRDEPSLREKVDFFDTPIFIARFCDRKILAVNSALEEVFGITEAEALEQGLDGILAGNAGPCLHSIYESLIFDGKWKGTLCLQWHDDSPFSAKASIRAASDLGTNLLWFSLLNPRRTSPHPGEAPTQEPPAPPAAQQAMEAISKAETMADLLSLILAHQPAPRLADAIIYSDVNAEENRVRVYGSGAGLTPLSPGHTHPYEGSIAENIKNFRLDHLILTETTESIKPIDWSLFIPMGIHSYFAKPFFDGDRLTSVLIFCSSQPDTFTEENVAPYASLYPAFLHALNRWKKRSPQAPHA